MKKVAAGLIVIGSISIIVFYFIVKSSPYNCLDRTELQDVLLISFIFSAAGIYYIFAPFFGATTADQIEKQNQILKKQIEQKELLKKLNDLG
jgi:hypothetical protein